MTTKMKADFTLLDSGRTVEAKLGGMVDALDYGATVGGTAVANTVAINKAIQAATIGYVTVPCGVSYVESSLVLTDNITLLIFGENGVITFLTADTGDSAVSSSGIAIKQQGTAGVLLRAVDFGVAAEPFIQVVDLATGDIAATHTKFIELDEISAPANPSANKCRLYVKDNGSGKTLLVAQFPTGNVITVAEEGAGSNLTGSVTYDPASIADGTNVSTTVTVTGAVLGDTVIASFSNSLQGVILNAFVSGANTVTCYFHNETGAAVDLASGTLKVVVMRGY